MVSQPRLPLALGIACMLALPSHAAAETTTAARDDGSLIHYSLDRPAGVAEGVIVIAQGSGCTPGAQNQALATVRAAFADYVAVIVEKVGITPNAPISDGFTDCPTEFAQRYTLTQRMDDYRQVLNQLRREPELPMDNLVLFGGSEGGLAVAGLAATLNPRATVLLSTGGGTTFGEMVLSTVPPEGIASVNAGFAAARANPESSEILGGSTYRFWADAVDVKFVDFMLETSSPFLLIQGGLDTSGPVATARLTADAFAADARCNLTYWEFPALDHGMKLPDGTSRLAAIADLAAQWVKAPLPAC